MDKKLIQEITTFGKEREFTKLGNLQYKQPVNNTTSIDFSKTKTNIRYNPNIGKISLTPWQTDIVTSIRSGRNVFVNVSPAGGKSLPIQKIWMELLSNSTRGNIPKIIWVCENKALTAEVFNGLRERIISMLDPTSDIRFPDFMIPYELRQYSHISPRANPALIRYIDSLIGIMMGDSSGADRSQFTPNKIAYSCTYMFAPNLIQLMKPRIIVIDELQERFKPLRPSLSNQLVKTELAGLESKTTYFMKTIEAAPANSSIALLTGSMHPDTSNNICKVLEDTFNKKFVKIMQQTAYNRASIAVVPYDNMSVNGKSNVRKISQEIVEQIRNNQKYNLIAVFSKNKILQIIENVCNSTPKRSVEETVGLTYKKQLNHPRNKFEPNQIIDMLKKEQGERTLGENPNSLANHLRIMISGQEGSDQILGNALLHGVGYVMSGDGDRSFNSKDLQLITTLLKNGLINTVLATTAVGVGVNLKIRNLYIPTIIGPFGGSGRQDIMDASSFIQLIHRSGRKSDEVATIYCSSKDIAFITNAIHSGDPSTDFVPAIPYFDDNGQKGTGIHSRLKMSKMDQLRNIVQLISN